MYGAGGMTPAYGMGGATPMYGAGGRTPLLPLGGRTPAMGGGRTPAMGGATPNIGGGAPEGPTATQAAITVAVGLGLAGDATWCYQGVRVDISGGSYAGKRGVVKKVSEPSASATVTIEGSSNNVTVAVSDLRPRRPTGEAGTYVRVIGGAHAGKRLQVLGGNVGEDVAAADAELVVRVGESDDDLDFLPVNVVVACD